MVKIVDENDRLVIYRLGKLISKKGGHGPGIVFLVPFIDRIMERVSIRIIAMDIPPQDIITKDNVSLNVNAVVYYRVIEPESAVVKVENYTYAISQLAQTTLRSVCGQSELDTLLADRDSINSRLQNLLDVQTDPWGIKVTNVEVKSVDLPDGMKRAMSRQAEAERERRAKVIASMGEKESAQNLSEAAEMLDQQPNTIQLRYLQTLNDIGQTNSKVIIFPMPMDLISAAKKIFKEES